MKIIAFILAGCAALLSVEATRLRLTTNEVGKECVKKHGDCPGEDLVCRVDPKAADQTKGTCQKATEQEKADKKKRKEEKKEKEAKEKADKEAKEKADKEAKEKAYKEAKLNKNTPVKENKATTTTTTTTTPPTTTTPTTTPPNKTG